MGISAAGPRTAPANSNGDSAHAEWLGHTRVMLQPIAAPSILGLLEYELGEPGVKRGQ